LEGLRETTVCGNGMIITLHCHSELPGSTMDMADLPTLYIIPFQVPVSFSH